MVVDYHTHTNYSDGVPIWKMMRAAEDLELDAIGFADHCNVSERSEMVRHKNVSGFNLDTTWERREIALEQMRQEFDTRILSGVEIDFHPDDVAEICAFLERTGFDYVIGSVHFIEDVNIHVPPYFAEKSRSGRRAAVDRYFDMLIQMIESELVDIAAHMDVIERNPELRDIATEEHYHRVADALESSETVPEINAGRVLQAYGKTHPHPDFFEILRERDARFTRGSDAHTPEELKKRTAFLTDFFEEKGMEPVELDIP